MGKAVLLTTMIFISAWFSFDYAMQPSTPTMESCKKDMATAEISLARMLSAKAAAGAAIAAALKSQTASDLEHAKLLTTTLELKQVLVQKDQEAVQSCVKYLQDQKK